MKRYARQLIGGVILASLLLVLPGRVLAQALAPGLLVATGELVAGNVATLVQPITIDGEVTGDVTSWSGDILVRGRVGGDVVSYVGRVTLAGAGQVGGSVLAPGGGVERAGGALVAGQTFGDANGSAALASAFELFVPPGPRASVHIGPVGRLLFGMVSGVLLLAFALLWGAFWPQRTTAAAWHLRRAPGRALALGLLTTGLLAALLLPLLALLAASLLGLPLAALLLVVLHVPYLFGLAVLVRVAGIEPIEGALTQPRTLAICAALVLAVAVATVLLPLGGLLIGYLLASLGLGAVLLSRGGVSG